jgi:hypothetical protein
MLQRLLFPLSRCRKILNVLIDSEVARGIRRNNFANDFFCGRRSHLFDDNFGSGVPWKFFRIDLATETAGAPSVSTDRPRRVDRVDDRGRICVWGECNWTCPKHDLGTNARRRRVTDQSGRRFTECFAAARSKNIDRFTNWRGDDLVFAA